MAHFIVKSFLFKMLVVICIGANIVIIGMDRYPASIIDSIYLEKVNIFFTAVQLIEMVLMQIAYGVKYAKDPYNIFDFVLVAISVFEVVYTLVSADSHDNKLATWLRSVRILRIIKIAK